MHRTALLFTVLLFTVPGLQAQRVTLVGVVRDSLTGNPLQGVTVWVPQQALATRSSRTGGFTLSGVEAGQSEILFRQVGYHVGSIAFELTAGPATTVDLGAVALVPIPTELSPLVVTGEEPNDWLRSVGFYHRSQFETGTFFTQADIAEQNPTLTSDLFRRVPGFRVFADGSIASTRGIPSISQAYGMCEVDYYIDGLHVMVPDVDIVIPTSISAMEIYRGAASIPPRFRRSTNPKCGVVAIWTRDGGEP
ncbi:MAG: carboxypeptidase regulatory-like domain-containing protein [Gemmatimonadetes bacterium]|nr:carboxypeptidase regulatory-like domain-containing protein [Gemmatimonadota bacterium]